MNALTMDSILRALIVAAAVLALFLCAGCARLFRSPAPERFELRVLALNNDPIAGASVTVISPDTVFRAEARYDSLRGIYYLEHLPVEQFIVTIAHRAYDTLSRNMSLARIGRPGTIYLDRDTVAYTYSLGRKVEYRPYRQWIAVMGGSRQAEDIIDLMRDMGVARAMATYGNHVMIFQKDDDFDRFDSPELKAVRSLGNVLAGGLLKLDGRLIYASSDEILLTFDNSMPLAKRDSLFGKYGLKLVRREAGVDFVRASPGIGEGINDIVRRLVEVEGVGAEPAKGVYGDHYQE